GDTQHVVDIRGGQRYGVECVADGPRSDLECSLPKFSVEVSCGFRDQAPGSSVFRRKVEVPLLDVRGTEKLLHNPVLQAEERPYLFLRIGSAWKCASDRNE